MGATVLITKTRKRIEKAGVVRNRVTRRSLLLDCRVAPFERGRTILREYNEPTVIFPERIPVG